MAELHTCVKGIIGPANAFYGASVAMGGVTVAPTLYSGANAFYPASAALGAVTLSPALLSGATAFHAAGINASVTLSPPVVGDEAAFYAAELTQAFQGDQTLTPAIFGNSNVIYLPSLSRGTYPLAGQSQAYPGSTEQAYPGDAAPTVPGLTPPALPLAGVAQPYPMAA